MGTRQNSRPEEASHRSRTGTRRTARDQSEKENRRSASAGTTHTDTLQSGQTRHAGTAVQENTQPVHSSAEEVVFHPAPEQRQTRRREGDSRETRKETQKQQRLTQRTQERQKQLRRRKNRPAVSYVEAKPFNLNRLLLQLAVVLGVVAAITLGLSMFFKVEKVVVYGNSAYDAWTIQEASGIETGSRLLSINNARASGKIKAALPYVDTVRVGIKLPDTVNIYIEELPVAYAIQTEDETWWLMTSEGRIDKQIDAGTAGSYTQILGVTLDSPAEGEQAKAVLTTASDDTSTAATDATDGSTTAAPMTVTGTDRLNAALQIVACLESNDLVGEIASVDVSSLTNIELWYGQRYQVKLGDTSDLEKKIAYMAQAVSQQKDYEMGVLDVSFTTWPDQVGYTPFE